MRREYRYLVDREGRVYHDGSEIVDPQVLRFFLRAMRQTPDGRYLVVCQGEYNWFETADTPFVVRALALEVRAGELAQVELRFAGDVREPLDPRTLETEGGSLYCRIRGGAFRARFGRVALQQLAPYLVEGPDGPALQLGGTAYPIGHGVPTGP